MKHYGVWITSEQRWLVGGDGKIFWTTSKAVAVAQLKVVMYWKEPDIIVKEFPEVAE